MIPFTLIPPLKNWELSGGWLDVYSDGAGGWYQHAGRDLVDAGGPAATAGAPLYACQAGTALVNHEGDGWGNGSFGSCVRIDHPQGDGTMWSITAHMARDSVAVETGQYVEQGQFLGRIGLTGRTSGYHTHFAVQSGGGGGFDPMRYLEGGVWRMGNPGIRDPWEYLAAEAGPPAPVVVVTLEERVAALEALIAAQAAVISRMDNQAIVLGPDGAGYSPVESVRRLNAAIHAHAEAHPGPARIPAHVHSLPAVSGNVIEAKG